MNHGQFASNAVSAAGNLAPATPPTLEDRLDHLHRGCDRLTRLRVLLGSIADRIAMVNGVAEKDVGAKPAPPDLSSRFGEAIHFAHTNLDSIEYLVSRIECALFNSAGGALQEQRRTAP